MKVELGELCSVCGEDLQGQPQGWEWISLGCGGGRSLSKRWEVMTWKTHCLPAWLGEGSSGNLMPASIEQKMLKLKWTISRLLMSPGPELAPINWKEPGWSCHGEGAAGLSAFVYS